ncbi:MAG: HDOD domain-containing protein [Candidatus Krumholzibacteriia bacterium]
MKKSILFVDDDANVLGGLRRMLRGQRETWDCEFVDSGPAALALLAERGGFDVIVTDMRMPGMDGAQLLEQVKLASPHTVRLVLSGQSDQELTMKAVGPAHQFLSKPCDADTLVNVIKRACALRDRLAPGGLANLVSQLDRLPSMPGIYRRLVHELQSPDVGVAEVGRIIAEDPAMTSKILQLVNSSFFCFQQHITDPVQAAMILGINTIKALVLSVHVFGQLAADVPEELHISAMQSHSLITGNFARAIVLFERGGKPMGDEAFVAGLLHDIGRLAIAANLPDAYRQAILLSQREGTTLHDTELAVFGATHAEVGAYLLGLWGLPETTVEAVAFHHAPAASPVRTFGPLAAVHAADIIDHERAARRTHRTPPAADLAWLGRLEVDRHLDQWRAACGEIAGSEVPA